MGKTKKIFSLLLAVIMMFSIAGISASAEEVITIIKTVEADVIAPQVDETVSGDNIVDTEGCKVTRVKWTDEKNGAVVFDSEDTALPPAVFKAGNDYSVELTFAVDEGYTLDAVNGISVVINGQPAKLKTISSDGSSATAEYTFQCKRTAGNVFGKILELLGSILLAAIRLLGAMIGIG